MLFGTICFFVFCHGNNQAVEYSWRWRKLIQETLPDHRTDNEVSDENVSRRSSINDSILIPTTLYCNCIIADTYVAILYHYILTWICLCRKWLVISYIQRELISLFSHSKSTSRNLVYLGVDLSWLQRGMVSKWYLLHSQRCICNVKTLVCVREEWGKGEKTK